MGDNYNKDERRGGGGEGGGEGDADDSRSSFNGSYVMFSSALKTPDVQN